MRVRWGCLVGRRNGRADTAEICSGQPILMLSGDHGFEEQPGAAGVVERQRARDLDLAHRQLSPVSGGTVLAAERRRDAADPVVKERLDVTGAERVADRLQALGL
jgi:hypothetical protein